MSGNELAYTARYGHLVCPGEGPREPTRWTSCVSEENHREPRCPSCVFLGIRVGLGDSCGSLGIRECPWGFVWVFGIRMGLWGFEWVLGDSCGSLGIRVGVWDSCESEDLCGSLGIRVGPWGFMWVFGDSCGSLGIRVFLGDSCEIVSPWGFVWVLEDSCGSLEINVNTVVTVWVRHCGLVGSLLGFLRGSLHWHIWLDTKIVFQKRIIWRPTRGLHIRFLEKSDHRFIFRDSFCRP